MWRYLVVLFFVQTNSLIGGVAYGDSEKIKPRETRNAILEVGPGKQFALPSEASAHAKDGDTVLIYADGTYFEDTAVWKANNLIIRGVGGRPHIRSHAQIANGKAIWVLTGDNYLIQNIEFSGARVRDRNGAALRVEGADLHVTNCYIHDNENGILTGANPDSEITIENSEFAFNGDGSGYTHNLYIGRVKSFNFVGNLSHHARVGHALKSRALNNRIFYNRLMDSHDGNASYLIDLPEGGFSLVLGNVIQQGPKAENSALLAYGAEGLGRGNNALYVAFNTFVNTRHTGVFVKAASGSKGMIANNLYAGKGRVLEGLGPVLQNNLQGDGGTLFIDFAAFDFRLREDAAAIDRAVSLSTVPELKPESQISAFGLVERMQYGKALDLGAFEYTGH